MASKASEISKNRIDKGLVITKYGHLKEGLDHFECMEAIKPELVFENLQKLMITEV